MTIESIRTARGLSQVELADITGLSQSAVSRAENLEPGTTIRTMMTIAAALKVPLSELFDDRPAAEQAILSAFRQMPPEKQALWVAMSRTFAQYPA